MTLEASRGISASNKQKKDIKIISKHSDEGDKSQKKGKNPINPIIRSTIN